MFLRLKSKRWDFTFGDVSSALQKAIRRNNRELLINMAVELDIGAEVGKEDKKKQVGYGGSAWKTLQLCCSEDISICHPNAAIQIHKMYKEWGRLKKKGNNKMRMKKLLVRACKMLTEDTFTTSRIVGYASTWSMMVKDKKLEKEGPGSITKRFKNSVPLDKQDANTKIISGAKDEWFYFYGMACVAHVATPGNEMQACYWLGQIYLRIPKKGEEKREDLDFNKVNKIDRIWKVMGILLGNKAVALHLESISKFFIKRNPKGSTDRLPLFHLALALSMKRSFGKLPVPKVTDEEIAGYYGMDRVKPTIPDYVHDKHTAQGKKLKRGVAHFFGEGAYLKNESKEFQDVFKVPCQKIYLNEEKRHGTSEAKYQRMRGRIRNGYKKRKFVETQKKNKKVRK